MAARGDTGNRSDRGCRKRIRPVRRWLSIACRPGYRRGRASPKWSTVPRPLRPSTPDECASSIIMMAPCRSAISTSAGSGAISPSIEKTPSVMRSLRPGLSAKIAQNLTGGGDVAVREDVDLGLGEPAAVDDAGVVQLVGDNVVVRSEDGRDRAGVGREAGLKHNAGFHIFELRDASLPAPCGCPWCRRWSGRRPTRLRICFAAAMAASTSLGWSARPR